MNFESLLKGVVMVTAVSAVIYTAQRSYRQSVASMLKMKTQAESSGNAFDDHFAAAKAAYETKHPSDTFDKARFDKKVEDEPKVSSMDDFIEASIAARKAARDKATRPDAPKSNDNVVYGRFERCNETPRLDDIDGNAL